MGLKVLVAGPLAEKNEEISKFLKGHRYECSDVNQGKNAQLSISKEKFFAIILDFEIENNSSLTVIRFIKATALSVKIILIVRDKSKLIELELEEKDLLKLGISTILYETYTHEQILNVLENRNLNDPLKNFSTPLEKSVEQEITLDDKFFTKIKIGEFLSGNTTIFDLYIRQSENQYLKILESGHVFDQSRIKYYRNEVKVEYLYFQTKDRIVYLEFINNLISRIIDKKHISSQVKLETVKNIFEMYIDEVHLEGLKPQLVEIGMKVCNNMYHLIKQDKSANELLNQLEKFNPTNFNHAFLVCFYSNLISTDIPWIGGNNHNLMIITIGSLFHDIGLTALPPQIANASIKDLTEPEYQEFRKHPKLGVEILRKFPSFSEQVQLVVSNHHELSDGTGYPQGHNDVKIYPPAKIIGLVDFFVDFIKDNKTTPSLASKIFTCSKEVNLKFNKVAIQALINIFKK